MHFTSDKESLNKNIKKVAKVSPLRSTTPILESILFNLEGNNLKMRSSDIEITMQISLEVTGIEDGNMAIPTVVIQNIINELDDGIIEIQSHNDGKITLKSNNGHYDINGRPSDEFPSLPIVEESHIIEVDKSLLSRMIRKTLISVGKDELKPSLLGVLFEISNNEIRLVSTDVHKLVSITSRNFSSPNFEGRVIIPKNFLQLLQGYLLGDGIIKLSISKNHVKMDMDNTEIYTRIIDEKFPDYSGVIPVNNSKIAIFNTQELYSTLKRVSIFSNQRTRQIALKVEKEQSQISTLSHESFSSAEEKISMDYNDESITIGFNAQYFMDILGNIDTHNAIIKMNTALSPNLIIPEQQLEDEELLMILMPIRLESND